MTERQPKDLAASVRQRLLNWSQREQFDFQYVLTRYGIERLLYRLSRSPFSDRFVLKGAMLFVAWEGWSPRPTRDDGRELRRTLQVLERAQRQRAQFREDRVELLEVRSLAFIDDDRVALDCQPVVAGPAVTTQRRLDGGAFLPGNQLRALFD